MRLKTLRALPSNSRKTVGRRPTAPKPWDFIPHHTKGVPPLEPICAGTYAPAEGRSKIFRQRKTACEKGMAFSDSQAFFVCYFKSAPANACICVCYNGVKGVEPPCRGWDSVPRSYGLMVLRSYGLMVLWSSALLPYLRFFLRVPFVALGAGAFFRTE